MMNLEYLQELEGLLYPGTNIFSLACVTLAIIIGIRLKIVEPMHKIGIHGEEIVMRTPGTSLKEIMFEIHMEPLILITIDLEH